MVEPRAMAEGIVARCGALVPSALTDEEAQHLGDGAVAALERMQGATEDVGCIAVRSALRGVAGSASRQVVRAGGRT